ncbi:MAG TPA: ABC transporter ATP-binding protein [Kineosporiaceae bacterium]|nr:ABC transporter ATP-binding protein [Kineosporiaceae bacterium]
MTDGQLLRLAGVARDYAARRVLHPVDLVVRAGECVALLGPNGSGKSTLLRIAAGRDVPSAGQVLFDGRPLSEDDLQARARIAVVADGSGYYPDLSVREHLLLVAVAHGADDPHGWVDWALADRRLTEKADHLPSALSSGQTQALLLASALVRPRDLLVLDEPEQRLDPDARRDLATRIVAEKSDGVAVLLATHHVELAAAVAERVLLLDEGRVVGDGPPAEVLPVQA